MNFLELIESRHSVRDFTGEPVDRAVMERILRAAGRAPSPMNSQPWTFHVCVGESRAKLGEIISHATVYLVEFIEMLGPEHGEQFARWFTSLGDAPVVIVMSMPRASSEIDGLNIPLSMGAAMENLLLAAHAEGLGACNVANGWWVREEIREFLGLGQDELICTTIVLGHASDEPVKVTDRREDTVIWYE